MIWIKNYTLEDLSKWANKNMVAYLGIEFLEIGNDFLKAKMPVDHRTQMPIGLLHGGASCVLAETLGSCATYLCIDPNKYSSVGLEINANHIRGVTSGNVIGIARPIHLGRTTHVWDIRIHEEQQDRLVCVSRLTTIIIDKK